MSEDRVAPRTALRNAVTDLHRWDETRGWPAFNASLGRIDDALEAASLDSDELRSVLRVVAGDRHRALGHPGFFADCAVSICNEVRALLSAGDKAEAPSDE